MRKDESQGFPQERSVQWLQLNMTTGSVPGANQNKPWPAFPGEVA